MRRNGCRGWSRLPCQPDTRGVEALEKLDGFATAMALPDQGVNVTAQQADAGHQGHRAMTLVLMIAHHGRAAARQRRQIGRRRTDCPDAGLLLIGDDDLASVHAFPGARGARSLLAQDRDLAIKVPTPWFSIVVADSKSRFRSPGRCRDPLDFRGQTIRSRGSEPERIFRIACRLYDGIQRRVPTNLAACYADVSVLYVPLAAQRRDVTKRYWMLRGDTHSGARGGEEKANE